MLLIYNDFDAGFIQQIPENVEVIVNDRLEINKKSPLNVFRLAKFVNSKFKDKKDLCCINFCGIIWTVSLSLLIKARAHYSWFHYNPHNLCTPNSIKNRVVVFVLRAMYKRFDNIVNLCETQKKAFCDVFGKAFKSKIKICPNPVNVEEIEAKAKEKLDVGYKYIAHVSRIDSSTKDFYTLIDGYEALLKETATTVKLLIVGDGPDRQSVEEYAAAKRLEGNVVFAGSQMNPYKYMAGAECVVLSSCTEGFSMVVLEGLLCNGLVVASDCVAGPRDILQGGKYGLLFDVGDSKGLCRQLQRILTDEPLRQTLRELSKKRVAEINAESEKSLKEILR